MRRRIASRPSELTRTERHTPGPIWAPLGKMLRFCSGSAFTVCRFVLVFREKLLGRREVNIKFLHLVRSWLSWNRSSRVGWPKLGPRGWDGKRGIECFGRRASALLLSSSGAPSARAPSSALWPQRSPVRRRCSRADSRSRRRARSRLSARVGQPTQTGNQRLCPRAGPA